MANEPERVSEDPPKTPGPAVPAVPESPPPRLAAESHPPPGHQGGSAVKVAVAAVVVLLLVVAAVWLHRSLGTISTDDAYVDGHVTFVAPRVSGQVERVFVEDNNRVRKGDLLLQLDREPFEVQLRIAQASVGVAQSDLANAEAQARGLIGQARSMRFGLEHAIELVDNQVALLNAKLATLKSARATAARTKADFDRIVPIVKSGSASKEEYDKREEAMTVALAEVDEALQAAYEVRVSLGLPPKPQGARTGPDGDDDLAKVPEDLNQTFSAVRQAQANLISAASQLGVVDSFNKSPRQLVEDFYKRDPQGKGDIDRIYEQVLHDAPTLKQAQAKLMQAQRNRDQAALNLRYCDVVAEIDGVVTRREVNPGNNVVAGQSVMAVRSVSDIWVDANFKETQLAKLRIGQSVDVDVDMYGSSRRFKGRVTGFRAGTGSTLSLLPAENATGNFVKVVQRLPVRIDLLDYDAEKEPLFAGLSVTPTVHVDEAPTGDSAGKLLQPYSQPTTRSSSSPATAAATQASRTLETVR
jgi:membrane fusion protein (multidrug efflux system)